MDARSIELLPFSCLIKRETRRETMSPTLRAIYVDAPAWACLGLALFNKPEHGRERIFRSFE